jgi:DNA repair protein RecO (recombination protein O)
MYLGLRKSATQMPKKIRIFALQNTKYMLSNTHGIVLRSVKYGETSLIFDVYTQAWGMRTYIAHGVRQAKSRISYLLLRPAALLDMVVYHVADKEINHIKEIKPSYIYTRLPFSVKHGAVGLFMSELLQKTMRDADASPDLFAFIHRSFEILDQSEHIAPAFFLIFMSQLSVYLGFAPQVDSFTPDSVFDYRNGIFVQPEKGENVQYFDPESSQYLVDVCCTELQQADTLSIPAPARAQLYRNLLDFYSFHVSGLSELQSYEVLKGIF